MHLQEPDNMQPARRRSSFARIAIVAGFVIVAVSGAVVAHRFNQRASVIDFATCQDAGGMVAESYPRQCMIDDRTFAEETRAVREPDDFIGLSEEEALSIVKRKGQVARVVMRDGEYLPITMDYVPGRHSFYVVNGVVSRVSVEPER